MQPIYADQLWSIQQEMSEQIEEKQQRKCSIIVQVCLVFHCPFQILILISLPIPT